MHEGVQTWSNYLAVWTEHQNGEAMCVTEVHRQRKLRLTKNAQQMTGKNVTRSCKSWLLQMVGQNTLWTFNTNWGLFKCQCLLEYHFPICLTVIRFEGNSARLKRGWTPHEEFRLVRSSTKKVYLKKEPLSVNLFPLKHLLKKTCQQDVTMYSSSAQQRCEVGFFPLSLPLVSHFYSYSKV